MTKPRGESGFAVVIVLLAIIALGVQIAIMSGSVRNAVGMLDHDRSVLRGETAARSAVDISVARLLAADERQRWVADGSLHDIVIDEVRLSVRLSDEGARVNVNHADAALLAGLFVAAGAAKREADAIAERIVKWRSDAANDARRSATPSSQGDRRRFLLDPVELMAVGVFDTALFERIAPHVTVHSKDATINPGFASSMVLRALPGVAPQALEAALRARENDTGMTDALAAALEGTRPNLSNDRGSTIRIEITVRDGGAPATGYAMAVVGLKIDTDAPFRTLAWRFEPVKSDVIDRADAVAPPSGQR
jgi:general secretion pathway protein K